MNKVVDFKLEPVDFDTAVDEVDVIIPKYLEALEQLDGLQDFGEMSSKIEHVITYWTSLDRLFTQLRPLSEDVPFDSIIKNTLQTELATLERAYLRVNMAIEFSKAAWSEAMWECAEKVLTRMDFVLEGLGFEENHRDRLFIQELQTKNLKKYHWWQLKYRLTADNDE